MAGTEHETKTASEKRKGRLFRVIMYGLSWSFEIRAQVPPALWARLKDGWQAGPLIKSMTGIPDPDQAMQPYHDVTWTAWLFAGVFGPSRIFIQSNVMGATEFIDLVDVAGAARANPGDSPTDGL